MLQFNLNYIYFSSCLSYQCTIDINLTNVKCEAFIFLVINIFAQTLKEVVQATNNYTFCISEINQNLVHDLLSRWRSTANSLLNFSLYNPSKLNRIIPEIIKNHLCMVKYIYLSEFSENGNYWFMDVFDDFSLYCKHQREVAFNFLLPFYDEIFISPCVTSENLIIFIENIDMNCSAANDLMNNLLR